jgi:hypothetical protein
MFLQKSLRASLALLFWRGLASLYSLSSPPLGGGAAVGPARNVAVRGPAGNVAAGNTNVYRGSYTNVYGGAYPYYGAGAAVAGLAVGAAVGAAATAPYRRPITNLLAGRLTRRIRPTAHTRIEPYSSKIEPRMAVSTERRWRPES